MNTLNLFDPIGRPVDLSSRFRLERGLMALLEITA